MLVAVLDGKVGQLSAHLGDVDAIGDEWLASAGSRGEAKAATMDPTIRQVMTTVARMTSSGSTGRAMVTAAGVVTAWQNAMGASSRAASTRGAGLGQRPQRRLWVVGKADELQRIGKVRTGHERIEPADDAGTCARYIVTEPGQSGECGHRRQAAANIANPG